MSADGDPPASIAPPGTVRDALIRSREDLESHVDPYIVTIMFGDDERTLTLAAADAGPLIRRLEEGKPGHHFLRTLREAWKTFDPAREFLCVVVVGEKTQLSLVPKPWLECDASHE